MDGFALSLFGWRILGNWRDGITGAGRFVEKGYSSGLDSHGDYEDLRHNP
jgi:hypothetical protein